jgi:glycosyltransferase involved in cell wall biosynthesis
VNILHIISSIDRGGAENHLFSLIKKQKKSHKIFLCYFRGNDFWFKKYQNLGVKIDKINISNSFNLFMIIYAIIYIFFKYRKYQSLIIHCHLSISEFVGFFLKFFLYKKIKFIITKHLDSFYLQKYNDKNEIFFKGIFFEKIILSFADHVIFISHFTKNYFLKFIKIKKEKYSVIHYGISAKEWPILDINKKKKLKLKYKISDDTFVIGNIARHVPQKGIFFLIKSYIQYLKITKKKSKLILIGHGPESKKIDLLIKTHKLEEKITRINFTESINEFYSVFDIFVLSSKFEGLGLVLLESLIKKVPIIATNQSSIKEIIINKKNGLLVKFNNVNEMALKIKKLEDKFYRKKLTIHNNFILNKKFNLQKMVELTNDVYKKTISLL